MFKDKLTKKMLIEIIAILLLAILIMWSYKHDIKATMDERDRCYDLIENYSANLVKNIEYKIPQLNLSNINFS